MISSEKTVYSVKDGRPNKCSSEDAEILIRSGKFIDKTPDKKKSEASK